MNDEVEGRLAELASRLVLDSGVRVAQQELTLAACRAERAFVQILALSGRVGVASDTAPDSTANVGRSARRAHALARKVQRQTARRAGSSGAADGTRPSSSLPHEHAVFAAEATQLFMLLALSPKSGGGSAAPHDMPAGRELLSLLLPRAYQSRYLGVPLIVAPRADARLGSYPLTLVLYSAAIVV